MRASGGRRRGMFRSGDAAFEGSFEPCNVLAAETHWFGINQAINKGLEVGSKNLLSGLKPRTGETSFVLTVER